MKTLLSRLCALLLVAVLFVSGCASTPGTERLSGDYSQDAATAIAVLREAVNLPEEAENGVAVREDALAVMDAFAARYKANKYSGLQSFTTLRTVFNTVGSTYRKSVARPIRNDKVDRVKSELDRAEQALLRNR
jgi:photosystem II Psb27 protein